MQYELCMRFQKALDEYIRKMSRDKEVYYASKAGTLSGIIDMLPDTPHNRAYLETAIEQWQMETKEKSSEMV